MAPTVVEGPCFDGSGIVRAVEEDGWVYAESWEGPERGWVRGGVDLATVLGAIPASPETLALLEVPPEEATPAGG